MPKTVRQILKILKKDGWYKYDQNGSHMQLRHPTKKGKVTLPVHNGDVDLNTEKSIWKQAGLK